MPDPNRINFSRDELAQFIPSHKSIKAFEQVVERVSDTLPSAIAAVEINAGAAGAAAYAALAQLVEVADLLMLMLSGPLPAEPQEKYDLDPRVQPILEQEDLAPRVNVGTLGAQNSDNIEVTGGTLTGVTVNGVTITQPATGATLTLADNSTFATAGAFTSTFTMTGATGVTFPTTGTLATLAGAEALTNKTYNGNTWTAGTGTLTLGAGKTATISNTLTLTATDGSTLAIGTGGTLGGAAYIATTAPTNYTPTDQSGAGLVFAGGTAGIYFVIGKLVFVSGRVVYPATANASQAAISIPLVCGVAGQPKYNAAGVIIGGGTANKIGPDRGSSVAYLYTTGSTGATNAGQSGQTLDFSFCYLTV